MKKKDKIVIKPVKMRAELRDKTLGSDFPKLVRLIAENWQHKDKIIREYERLFK